MRLAEDDPLAVAVCAAIRGGDLHRLRCLLADEPELVSARIVSSGDCTDERTLLHIATDWSGHYPNAAATVEVLIAPGADVNGRFVGRHAETPLHWAASSDDVAVLDVLLAAGADTEARGAVIGGGTPLADAVAFGQWNAARRLVERGAQTTLWQAAALGLIDRVERAFTAAQPPNAEEITNAFWCACHGGQRATAANINRTLDGGWWAVRVRRRYCTPPCSWPDDEGPEGSGVREPRRPVGPGPLVRADANDPHTGDAA